jgi:hypothetical protein
VVYNFRFLKGASMTTAKQIAANRKNAFASTGPRTPEGKAIVAKNAVKHGMTGTAPVVEGLEREEDWQQFKRQVSR